VEFAGKYRVPTRVLSSLTDPALPVEEEARSGTLITFEEDPHMAMEKAVISGVAFNRDEAKITVHDVPDRPGVAYAILGPIADSNIDVDVIVQNIGHDGMTDLSFTVHRTDYAKAMKLLKSQVQPHIKCRDVTGDDRIAKVSIVGMGMRSHAGIELHVNATPSGRSRPDYAGEVTPYHGLRITPELSWGLVPDVDWGLYLPFVRSGDGTEYFAGPRFRLKWMPLRSKPGYFAGVN